VPLWSCGSAFGREVTAFSERVSTMELGTQKMRDVKVSLREPQPTVRAASEGQVLPDLSGGDHFATWERQ